MDIAGKAAVITGGASGIGKTTALALAAKGASLMLIDLNPQLGDETVKQIEAVARAPSHQGRRPRRGPDEAGVR